jgi:hypothetical protein
MSKFSFPRYWKRCRKSWWLGSKVGNGGAVYWWQWRHAAYVLHVWRLFGILQQLLWQERLRVLVDCICDGAPRESRFLGWKPMVWPSLVVHGNDLAEGIFLWSQTFSRVKIQDLQSGDDNVDALFPSWRRCFWRIYSTVRVVSLLMVRVLLRVFNHCDGVFIFYFSLFIFSGLCVHHWCFRHWVGQKLGVIVIFTILKYSPYKYESNGSITFVIICNNAVSFSLEYFLGKQKLVIRNQQKHTCGYLPCMRVRLMCLRKGWPHVGSHLYPTPRPNLNL